MKKLFICLTVVSLGIRMYGAGVVGMARTGNGIGVIPDYSSLLVFTNISVGAGGITANNFTGNGSGLTNIAAPVLVSTNWVSGFVYTNLSGRLQEVQVAVSCTAASISGGAVVRLQSGATQAAMATIAQFGMQTISGSLVVTNTGIVTGKIPSGNVFSFTNLVGGAGDSAINLPGTGQLLTY